ncbi:MAG: hypothetical protein L0L57_03015 [Alkalibacterium sp.]|nr:hypothetical protein [Alkalibacterium sp.]
MINPIKSIKAARNKKRMKNYIENVRADVFKKSVGGKLNSGKQTQAPWDNNFFKNLDQPVKRHPQRNKEVLNALRYLRDINPDASMAVWNFMRMANQGHEIQVTDVDGNDDEEMTNYINDDLAPRVGRIYGGGADQLINVLNLTGYTLGAEALEVELDDSLTEVVDFHPVDPARLGFTADENDNLQLTQKNDKGENIFLNPEQVFYIPIDPEIDDPYGRSPIVPAIESVLFQTEVLDDLKAVAHHQGHARFDVSVASEAIINAIPEKVLNDEDEVKKFVDDFLNSVEDHFQNIDPDDDFYHNDSIAINTVGGTAGQSMDAKALMEIIDQQIITSLKQFPILLGRNSSVSETHAKVQLELEYMTIRSIQKVTKRILEKAYNVALRARGSQSIVTVTFNDVAIKNRLEDAQAEEKELANEITKVNQGFIDNDEASNNVVGHDAVDEPMQQEQIDTSGADVYNSMLSKMQSDEEGNDDEPRKYRRFPSEFLFRSKGQE